MIKKIIFAAALVLVGIVSAASVNSECKEKCGGLRQACEKTTLSTVYPKGCARLQSKCLSKCPTDDEESTPEVEQMADCYMECKSAEEHCNLSGQEVFCKGAYHNCLKGCRKG